MSDPHNGVRIFSSPGDVVDPSKHAIHGTYNLEIKDVQWSDGGKYACHLWTISQPAEGLVMVFGKLQLSVLPVLCVQRMLAWACKAQAENGSA